MKDHNSKITALVGRRIARCLRRMLERNKARGEAAGQPEPEERVSSRSRFSDLELPPNAMGDGFLVVDGNGLVLAACAGAEFVFKRSSDAMVGRAIDELVGLSGADSANAGELPILWSAEGRLGGRRRSVRGKRPDGMESPLEMEVTRLRVDAVPFSIVVLWDIGARNRLTDKRRHAQRLETVGKLSLWLVGDINDLLASIGLNTERMKDLAGGDQRWDATIDQFESAVAEGADLAGRMLGFSSRQPWSPKAYDLADLIAASECLLHRILGESIKLLSDMPETLWSTFVDAHHLEGVLMNLAMNARDAMPRGGRIILLARNVRVDEVMSQTLEGLAPGEYIRLLVRDSGVGMPQEVKSRVMEPYFTTKSRESRSGLGLSMVHGFAVRSKGHVGIESSPGAGTTVMLHLPRARNATAPVSRRPKRSVRASKAGSLSRPKGSGRRITSQAQPLLDPFLRPLRPRPRLFARRSDEAGQHPHLSVVRRYAAFTRPRSNSALGAAA